MIAKISKYFSVLAAIVLILGCSDFTGSIRANQPKVVPEEVSKPARDGSFLPAEFANPNSGEFTERKMLINLGTRVFFAQAESFANQVPVFRESLRQYCRDLKSGDDSEATRDLALADWKRVMLAFHSLEGAPFGPFVAEGRRIVDNLYSYPYLNTCGIDQNVFKFSQEPIKVGDLLYNTKGFGAIEYLLFEESLLSKCNLRAHPQLKVWNELSNQQKRLHRCEWALQLTEDVVVKASELKKQWSPDQENYTLKLVDGSLYPNTKSAINALTDSMSHIELLKDVKLGRPLGRHKDCSEDKCPDNVEHSYSGISLEAAEAQLKSFRTLFYGSVDPQEKAYGFDDLLLSVGRADVLERVATALDNALVSIKKVQKLGTLKRQILEMDPALCKQSTMAQRLVEVCAVHADVREVAFLYKTEVLVALSLRAPPSQQGDND